MFVLSDGATDELDAVKLEYAANTKMKHSLSEAMVSRTMLVSMELMQTPNRNCRSSSFLQCRKERDG